MGNYSLSAQTCGVLFTWGVRTTGCAHVEASWAHSEYWRLLDKSRSHGQSTEKIPLKYIRILSILAYNIIVASKTKVRRGDNMGVRVTRATRKLGGSRIVTLPAQWVRYFGPRADHITIVGESLLVLAPEGFEAEADQLARELEDRSAANRRANNEKVGGAV